IMKYLHNNFQLSLNDHCVSPVLQSISADDEFIRLKLSVANCSAKVNKITVFNTCLVNSIDGHSNIFRAKINGKDRSFRLTENRISTEITY
ncbi:MAG: DUF6702 family protein, partial [Cyclobacteriaceae bacterium]